MEGLTRLSAMTPVVMAATELSRSILVATPTAVQADVYFQRITEIINRRGFLPTHVSPRQLNIVLHNTSVIRVVPEANLGRVARGMTWDLAIAAGTWDDARFARARQELAPSMRVAVP